MRTSPLPSLSILPSLTLSHHPSNRRRLLCSFSSPLLPSTFPTTSTKRYQLQRHIRAPRLSSATQTTATYVDHFSRKSDEEDEGKDMVEVEEETETGEPSNYDSDSEAYVTVEDNSQVFAGIDMKHLTAPDMDLKELEELPEQWRRSKVAWLCKELPVHKSGTLVRTLNAQRKWLSQEDATYVAVHCMRIRENETGFRVYKWMMQQHWYRFNFALATKLADYMGKERKFAKCREIFDDIINQGRVPSESTFHILVAAYLSAPIQGCLDEACSIYNRMIHLGGYRPRLSLHNALFRALVSKPGGSSKHYLKQAEFIFHNLVTTGLEIQKDIYGGLIWLHSYQDTVDTERITYLREEMKRRGFQEKREVLLSILRACSKNGDVEEADRMWLKLLECDNGGDDGVGPTPSVPSQAFVYRMEVYAKLGEFAKSLEIFEDMKKRLGYASVAAYHKIIGVLCNAQEMELAESFMKEFIESGKKPLMPSYIDISRMYFDLGLHEKLELTFIDCMEKCQLNRTIYNIYLDSLVEVGNLNRAREIFNQMRGNGAIGVNSRSCNTMLSGYLAAEQYLKAKKIYDLMHQKNYDIDSRLLEKLDHALSLVVTVDEKPVRLTLTQEQREIIIGFSLPGLRIESDEIKKKSHSIRFEFKENSTEHSVLRIHIHDQYHEWLHPYSKGVANCSDDIPYTFSTISHSYFSYYADQFWREGQPTIPNLIHRWLSPRVLAYWFMYGGYRTASGDIILKLKGNLEGVEKVVKTMKAMSIDCRVRRKGKTFWVGVMGSNSSLFWKLTEAYILDDMKDSLKPGGEALENSNGESECEDTFFLR